MSEQPSYTYDAVNFGPGQWMVHRFEDGKMKDERLMIVPPDWYEQQVIQRAIAEDSWA